MLQSIIKETVDHCRDQCGRACYFDNFDAHGESSPMMEPVKR